MCCFFRKLPLLLWKVSKSQILTLSIFRVPNKVNFLLNLNGYESFLKISSLVQISGIMDVNT